MQGLLAYFVGFGVWNWFILAVLLFVLEFMLPGVHFLWFGLAAAIVGILALATSIDALAVGLSLGVVRAGILYPAVIIGATSFILTIAGAKLGPVVGRIVGRRAELLGGLILIAIGVKILIEHLAG